MTPARRGDSPRRPFEETRLSARPPSNDLPTPEFLSLTYTLPYHLVEQINETAQITNRSRSEILADALRQYLDGGAAQPDHSHVATYEEYSYEETDAPAGHHAQGGSGGHSGYGAPPAHEASTKTVSETTRTEFKAWAARTKRTRVSTYESYSYEEVADDRLGAAPSEHASQPVLDVTPQEAASPAAEPEPVAPSAHQPPAADPPAEQAPAAGPPVAEPQPERAPADKVQAGQPQAAPAAAAEPGSPEPVAAEAVAAEPAAPIVENEIEPSAPSDDGDEPEATISPEPVLVPELIEDPEPAAAEAPTEAAEERSVASTGPDQKPDEKPTAASKPEHLVESDPEATLDAGPIDQSQPELAVDSKSGQESGEKPGPVGLLKKPAAEPTKLKAADAAQETSDVQDAAHLTDVGAGDLPESVTDPAKAVRGRLEALSDEPLDSQQLERCLATIMREIDKKDFSPPEHSSKVATMARDLAAAKGMRGRRLQEVYIAGLVHDIGKACVPDEIIKKPKPSSTEMAMIRRYPEFGADLLGAVPALQPVAHIVAAHQERWNGSGYPEGSVRTEIPVAAQIVALCDVYDVLNTARRYRPAYSQDRALQIIKQNVGTLWNPDIARVFLVKIVGEGQPLKAGARG